MFTFLTLGGADTKNGIWDAFHAGLIDSYTKDPESCDYRETKHH